MSRTTALICIATLATTALLGGCGEAGESRDAVYSSTDWTPPETAPRPVLARPRNTTSIGRRELVDLLASAGLKVKEIGPANLSLDDLDRFSDQPRSAHLLRVSDAHGGSVQLTFVELGSWRAAAQVDVGATHGFAVRNWLVLGSAGSDLTRRVTEALQG